MDDDLERINCDRIGEIWHLQCGWCHDHHKPMWECDECCLKRLQARFDAVMGPHGDSLGSLKRLP